MSPALSILWGSFFPILVAQTPGLSFRPSGGSTEGHQVREATVTHCQPLMASRQRPVLACWLLPKPFQRLHPLNSLETEYRAGLDLVKNPTRVGRTFPPVPQYPPAGQHLGESQASLGYREPQGYHFLAFPCLSLQAPPSWDPAASPSHQSFRRTGFRPPPCQPCRAQSPNLSPLKQPQRSL